MTQSLGYRDAGVDLDASADAKQRIARLVASTRTQGSLGAFGGFGGMLRFPAGMQRPVLVSSADGVGTKVRVAIAAGRHDTIGHDLVNHCVNDILVQGARPLFFLDYVAFGRLDPAVVEAIVTGVAAGCRENECELLGGETAEMPGIYTPPDYDLAGFITGCVEEDRILGAARVREGHVIVALASSGLHTNGYSLARRIVAERLELSSRDEFPGLGISVADALLAVHRSYLSALWPVIGTVAAMAHITGGGLPGNLGRVLPATLDAHVNLDSWQRSAVFTELQRAGNVSDAEMYRTFNMGVGMAVIVDSAAANDVMAAARAADTNAWILGYIVSGSGRVVLS